MPTDPHIKVGIIGASGLSGLELARLIDAHPSFQIASLGSTSTDHEKLSSFYPELAGTSLDISMDSIQDCLDADLDVLFLAVPHTKAVELVKQAHARGLRVIDLSADYRLQDLDAVKNYYGYEHPYPELVASAVYGLSELKRAEIAHAELLANPGCYPTASALALAPMLSARLIQDGPLIIDAKSGYSGAGRASLAQSFRDNIQENFYSYKALSHQHRPEIEQMSSELAGKKQQVMFVPHLLNIERGLLITAYLKLKTALTLEQVHQLYADFYADEPFIDLLELGSMPTLKQVAHTNLAQIGLALDEDAQVLVVECGIDNLVKGAAGQALQNANIMFGIEETCGLISEGV